MITFSFVALIVLMVLTSATIAEAVPTQGIPKLLEESMVRFDGNDDTGKNVAVVYRRSFDLSAVPARAPLHLFAYTRYELFINGKYVLRGPSRFENASPEYDTVDVAAYLRSGKNVVAVLVRTDLSNGRVMRHEPGMTFVLETCDTTSPITSAQNCRGMRDASIQPTDPDWGSIRDNIDARKSPGDWTSPKFDDSAWPMAVKVNTADKKTWPTITPRRIPLLRETEVLVQFATDLPIKLDTGEEAIARLPRISQAYSVIDFTADEGTILEVGYALPDGGHPKNRYIARAGRQTYVSGDTFGCDRLVLRITAGRATIHGVRAVEVIYPFTRLGRFQSSDADLNKLWDICVRSLELMSEDAYVDCADRERVEWMDCEPPAYSLTRLTQAGPIEAGKPVYADARLMIQMLRRTALTQQPDGRVKAHTCSDRWDIHAIMEDRACDWVEGIRLYHRNTNDTAFLKQVWPAVVKQMEWFLSQRSPRGLVVCREWIVWGNPMGYQVCEGTGMNAFVYRALRDAAYIGRCVSDDAAAARFDAAAEELSVAINEHLWNESIGAYDSGLFADGRVAKTGQFVKEFKLKLSDAGNAEPSMHANVFALDRGIVPADRRARVTKFALDNRSQANSVMIHHFLFTQMYAQNDPKWDTEVLAMIRQNWAPTISSKWGTTFEGVGSNWGSRVHIYGMVPGIFLGEYVLGVRYAGLTSGQEIVIEPRLGDLSSAEGTVVTELGPVDVKWTRNSGQFSFSVTVPDGATASLRMRAPPVATIRLNGKVVSPEQVGDFVFLRLNAGSHSGRVE